jgi:hypothetical protein
VTEIIYMANKGDARQVELITERLDKGLVMLATLASAQKAAEVPRALAPAPAEEAPAPPPEETWGDIDAYSQADSRAKLRMSVELYATNNTAALNAVLEKAPDSAKPALRRAIAVSVAGYKRALEALD